MKSFYSVLYLKSESISDEKIAVGLLLNTDRKPLFDYSDNKLKAASKIIDSEAIDSVEKHLKNIKRKVNSLSKDKNQIEAFDVDPFTSSYFDYLNRYSNNLILYSKPEKNIGDFKLDDFISLFRLLVDKNYGFEEKETVTFRKKVEETLRASKVSERVDIRYRVPKDRVTSILRNHEVDYIGANSKIYSGNVLDTTTDHYTIENKVYQIRALIDGLIELAGHLDLEKKGQHVVYYNEPEGRKQKDVIYDLRKDDTRHFDVKPWELFEEVAQDIERSEVKKFSVLLSKSG
jgi:flagellin-specific chaperone FliS